MAVESLRLKIDEQRATIQKREKVYDRLNLLARSLRVIVWLALTSAYFLAAFSMAAAKLIGCCTIIPLALFIAALHRLEAVALDIRKKEKVQDNLEQTLLEEVSKDLGFCSGCVYYKDSRYLQCAVNPHLPKNCVDYKPKH